MNKYKKSIKESKKNIAKRLRLSNKELWNSLSDDEHNKIIEKYYNLSSIENVGIYKILEGNANISRSLAILMMGIILGVTGGMAGNILLNYIPEKTHILFVVVFGVLVFYLFYSIDKINAKNLGMDRVLEYLYEEIKKEKLG